MIGKKSTQTKEKSVSAKPANLQRLYQAMGGIIGKKCWKAVFSYGGELCLHIGPRVPYESPAMAGEKKGAWILGTCGTAWRLITDTGRIYTSKQSEDVLEKKVNILENSTVTGFAVLAPRNGLVMLFNNGCYFHVAPTADDAKHDLPYWELFMPDNKLIAFGPGNVWSQERSDIPVS